jgi:CRP-like cAMP-binding protein
MYFKQSDLFSGMDHGFVKAIMAKAEKLTYRTGDIIFREGDETRYFYILTKGHVKLRIGRDEHTVYVLNRAGECFGWSSMIKRPHFSASAICAATTSLMRLDKTEVRTIMKANPGNGLIFMERMAGMIGDRLLRCYAALASPALLDLDPAAGTGQLQEALEVV